MKAGKGKNLAPSRQQLLAWISSTLDTQISSFQQLASGSVFCQLLNQAHPGIIHQHRINFQASQPYQFRSNFKLLQTAFEKLGIERPLAVEELVRVQSRDNFDLAVWFHGYLSSQLLQTDCTASSHERPQFDFSFAKNRPVVPKHFSVHCCQRGSRCSCDDCQEGSQRRLKQRIRELQTKFQMIGQVLHCGEGAEEICFLIEQIVDLSAV